MNICFLSKMFPPSVGGAETYAYELSNALGERGHKVDVYTQAVQNTDNTIDTNSNVTVRRLTKARKPLVVFETLYYSFRTRRSVDFSQYDVIHGTIMPASTIALTPGLGMTDVPLVVTSHGTSLGEARSVIPQTPPDYILKYFYHPINIFLDNIAGRVTDRIIAYSYHSRQQLQNSYRFGSDKLVFVPGGVNTNRFYPRTEPHPGIDPDKISLLYVGRLGPRKGIDRALHAVAQVDYPDLEFVIVGSGRLEPRLRELAVNLGISEQVNFAGTVPYFSEELVQLYSAADIFILPSEYEGFGLVLLEAMACGTPVIGTAIGGIPTVIDDEETGFLVPPTVDGVATALSRLVGNPDQRAEMGRTARVQAKDRDWSNIAIQIESVYKNLV